MNPMSQSQCAAPGEPAGPLPHTAPAANPLFFSIPFHAHRARNGRISYSETKPPEPAPPPPEPSPAAKLLALAHRLQGMLDRGEVKNGNALARRMGVTRTRVSQILAMTLLAPDIQEEVLFETAGPNARGTVRLLRRVAKEMDWRKQREVWASGKETSAQ